MAVVDRHGHVFMRQYVHGHAPALLGLAAAAALTLAAPAPAVAAAPHPCTPDGRSFPLTTRIHGGPDTYEPGAGFGTWYLDLVNTTRHTCEGIHPVVVLVDERHALKPSQPRLEFYDGPRSHAVRFEATDQDELVGVFGGAGLTVGPGRTLTVKVRLAVAEDAVPNEVTANAAVVQRHGDDGDWVGQSNDYRFGIGTTPGTRPDATTDPSTGPSPSPTSTPSSGGLPFTDAAEQLASTGPAVAAAVLGTAALLLVTAGAVLRARGRR
ncbi:hypothetical protein RKD19_005132 [Streptomyces canus]